jgi:hypothetical protein
MPDADVAGHPAGPACRPKRTDTEVLGVPFRLDPGDPTMPEVAKAVHTGETVEG